MLVWLGSMAWRCWAAPGKKRGLLLGPLRGADPADENRPALTSCIFPVFFFKYLYLVMYLAVLGLSCNMWDLVL